MSEEIKPCPACGGNSARKFNGQYSVICTDCDMTGPRHNNVNKAITAWNALPRALEWTTEPPKIEGYYWCRYKSEDKKAWSVAYVPAVTDWCGIDDENDCVEWSGPIPEPQESRP